LDLWVAAHEGFPHVHHSIKDVVLRYCERSGVCVRKQLLEFSSESSAQAVALELEVVLGVQAGGDQQRFKEGGDALLCILVGHAGHV
jgi:hypothetical protein